MPVILLLEYFMNGVEQLVDQHLVRLLLHGVAQVVRQVARPLQLVEQEVQLLLLRRRERILQN
jgi:hypothetical protein